MTLEEAKDILILRLDFRTQGAAPVSGRYFESENHIIKVSTIEDCQPKVDITDAELTIYLTQLKEECVYKVLSSVFDGDTLKDNTLECYPSLFDDLISYTMAISVFNLIITSTRSNRTERIGKEDLLLMTLELNGNNKNPHLPFSKGLKGEFRDELRRVKNKLFQQKRFVSVTFGNPKSFD